MGLRVFVITVQEQLCVYDALSTIVSLSSTPFAGFVTFACSSSITSLTNDYILYYVYWHRWILLP